VNVLAPIEANCELITALIDSIAVSMPTNAIIPKAIIKIVSTLRTMLVLMDCIEIRMFSFVIAPIIMPGKSLQIRC
jgi:hypothetical protein